MSPCVQAIFSGPKSNTNHDMNSSHGYLPGPGPGQDIFIKPEGPANFPGYCKLDKFQCKFHTFVLGKTAPMKANIILLTTLLLLMYSAFAMTGRISVPKNIIQ